ncbi:uncharacterized protein LOC116249039 isoform X2 [Nymphaea colorata]|uniref:uncharacterized protein LOC116249039 isoform X2 n=1 Tax=Nymphaea colorata TaxID=210225 RepID=UPI00129D7141|nr:uncharacterized protein LOC116249039 isoform X2 [Nymphaea colorata]XP_031478004.1 uncharacterized protein LOC116249039 isoform X2 [Nymphaea colorata]
MVRARGPVFHGKEAAAVVWLSSAALFFVMFRVALDNSSRSTRGGSGISNSIKRSDLYDKMARDLDEHGPRFLEAGATSQSLSLSDIFSLKDGSVVPILKVADPPVRANVLYLSPEYAGHLLKAVKNIFLPYFDKEIWFQNTSLYHFSMFHASHHLEPVPATPNEIEAEVGAVKDVSVHLCPLKIVLDRVVLTSTGVILGLWQVTSGTDPVTIRGELRKALPRAPQKQLYDPILLHTSFARLLGSPKLSSGAMGKNSDLLAFFHNLVGQVNKELHGFELFLSSGMLKNLMFWHLLLMEGSKLGNSI